MKAATIFLAIAIVLTAPGCASRGDTSEAAWRRGQCGYIIDDKLREKCLEQVEREFGR
jgi:hypothetical protein